MFSDGLIVHIRSSPIEAIILIIILPMALTLLCVGMTLIVMLAIRTLMIGQPSNAKDKASANKLYWMGMIGIPLLTLFFAFPTIKQFIHFIIVQTIVAYLIVLQIGCAMKNRIDNSPGTALQRFKKVLPPEPKGSTDIFSRGTLIVVLTVIVTAAFLQAKGSDVTFWSYSLYIHF